MGSILDFLFLGWFGRIGGVMLKRWVFIIGVCVALAGVSEVTAAEFLRTNGEVIKGEPVSFNEDGVVFRKDSGGYTDKIQWSTFTQDTLKTLAEINDPWVRYYTDILIERPLDLEARKVTPPPKVIIGEVERMNNYQPDPSFLSAWMSPAGLLLLIALYIGNMVAAYSIARFRRKQPALVCGVSAVLPILGPIIFLTQPEQVVIEEPVEVEETPEEARIKDASISTGANTVTKTMTRAATVKDSAAAGYEPAVYSKGSITFNRRFFETKFPTFFRPILGQKEKGVMFVITTIAGKSFEGIRYSRVTTGEIYLVPMTGLGEVSISIGQIESVEVKPRQ